MKIGYSLLLVACISLSLFTSCEDKKENKDGEDPSLTDNEYVNKWIYEEMDEWYLWRDRMPDESKLNFDSDPTTFFKSLLYAQESAKGYTFSTIESTHDNMLKSTSLDNNTVSSNLGFEYVPATTGLADNPVAFIVVYINKGTNVAAQGELKRGDIILKVDDKAITMDNYQTILYQNKPAYKLGFLDNTTSKTITVTADYEENPVFLDSIYIVNNRKIGYLVYNSYEMGDKAKRAYDVQVAQVLTKFQQQGVTDLVLDLRYNLGGYLESAKVLCSALVPNRSTKNILQISSYNSVKQAQFDALPDNNATKIEYLYDYFVDNVVNFTTGGTLTSIPKLGDQLNSVYIIGTGNTASASEMTINALTPYLKEAGKNIVRVGETTMGKNVGSSPISKDNDTRNTYVLHPISFKTHNKNKESNYASGFEPDIQADDFELLFAQGGLKPLGDKNETMLNVAISDITGAARNRSAAISNITYKKLRGSSLERKPTAYQLISRQVDK
ncbi:peptidase S41-like protein [Dysgonomonas alginatilytica]|uniref:Peptidase S41-like protein n=1 Tax=Dysgonomonas alginatilytica TaxID=1605892 RepID=A0A2V3PQL3_9BACT|nr:S41 family peptidase [Dysgonomonas alginatilytica]PXV65509.1 peptidase S41-like protein [Dysgonomonas alginatilytica]